MCSKGARTQTYRLLDAAVVVRVQDAIRAIRAVAGDEHTAEAVVLEAVAAARGLVAADGAALALRVPVELDTLAVGDPAAVLTVGRKRDGEDGGEDEEDSSPRFHQSEPVKSMDSCLASCTRAARSSWVKETPKLLKTQTQET